MRPELGRFLDPWPFDVVRLLRVLLDLAEGAGSDVATGLEGGELVFSRGDATGRGFLRVTPLPDGALLAFPAGDRLFDPQRRARGPRGSETKLMLRDVMDLDAYVRRLIAGAYAAEEPAFDDPF